MAPFTLYVGLFIKSVNLCLTCEKTLCLCFAVPIFFEPVIHIYFILHYSVFESKSQNRGPDTADLAILLVITHGSIGINELVPV